MNRQQAKEALANGAKLTHRYFTSEEWVKSMGDGMYIFEDGIMCNVDGFWMDRKDGSFDSGWHVLKKPTNGETQNDI